MTGLHTRTVDVAGVRGQVLTGGSGPASDAVLFVHGNPGAGADWMPLLEPVAEFATVLAPDMPGFGATDKRPEQGFAVPDHAAFLDGVVKEFGAQRVHLVAHDFGGPFALAWAADHLDQVASITLINTGVLLDYRWHRLARVWRTPGVGELAMRMSSPSSVKWLLHHDNPGLSDADVGAIAGHLAPAETRNAVLRLYRSAKVSRDMPALAQALRRFGGDTLVVWGTADVYLSADLAHRQLDVFPNARTELLPGVGHWAWLEQPERVAELVVPFLARQVVGNTEISETEPRRNA